MKLIALLFSALCFTISSSTPQFLVNTVMANVTIHISQEHTTDCIQIFRPDKLTHNVREKIFHMWRILAKPETKKTTGIYTFHGYVARKKRKPRKKNCYKTLKVLTGNEETRLGYVYLTHSLRVKDSIWLVFLDVNFYEFFAEADLLFDCEVIMAVFQSENLVHLYEVYRVRKDYPLRTSYYGNWTREHGLDVVKNIIYSRRKNLEGVTLKTGSIQNWPTTYLKESKWDGFLPKVWTLMEEIINCTSVTLTSVDGTTGLKNPNGTWNGLMGMITRGEIDIIVSEITIEKTRSHELDLFHPLIRTCYLLYFKQTGYNLLWTSIFKPFKKSIWFAILFWILLGSFTISLSYYISSQKKVENGAEKFFTPMRSFFFILQALSQQGHSATPKSTFYRILFLTSYMVPAVIIPSYSASLISYLTQQIPYRPFNSLEELYQDGTYRLLMKDNTAEYGYFANAKSKLLRDIFDKNIKTVPKEHEMTNTTQAFTTLCNHPKYAFFGLEIITNFRLGTILKSKCPILSTTKPISAVYLTMGAVKNSAYSGVINHFLYKMIITGVTNRILHKELSRIEIDSITEHTQVTVGEVFQVFIFLGLFVAISILILLVELGYHELRRENRKLKNGKHEVKNGDCEKRDGNLYKRKKYQPSTLLYFHEGYLN